MKITYHASPETVTRNWLHFDADGLVLGRLAARLATILQGKHKPTYTPHVDTGDFVVVTNAERIRVTGKKAQTKVYRHHTGHVGGLVERSFERVLATNPTEILELAVRRMLPKTKLGRRMMSKLKIYAGPEHPHEAQQPTQASL